MVSDSSGLSAGQQQQIEAAIARILPFTVDARFQGEEFSEYIKRIRISLHQHLATFHTTAPFKLPLLNREYEAFLVARLVLILARNPEELLDRWTS